MGCEKAADGMCCLGFPVPERGWKNWLILSEVHCLCRERHGGTEKQQEGSSTWLVHWNATWLREAKYRVCAAKQEQSPGQVMGVWPARETTPNLQLVSFCGSVSVTLNGDSSHEIKRFLLLGRKAMTNPDSILKGKDITLLAKVCRVKTMVVPVVMYRYESWTSSEELMVNFWTVVLEKTLESPLNCKDIKPVNPKGNQSWIFIGWTDADAPILWLPDAMRWLIRKDSDAGKEWRQEEKGMAEDKMVGKHHWLNGHESEQILGDSEGQGSLACCSPWSHKEVDWTTTQTLGKCSHGRTDEGRVAY